MWKLLRKVKSLQAKNISTVNWGFSHLQPFPLSVTEEDTCLYAHWVPVNSFSVTQKTLAIYRLLGSWMKGRVTCRAAFARLRQRPQWAELYPPIISSPLQAFPPQALLSSLPSPKLGWYCEISADNQIRRMEGRQGEARGCGEEDWFQPDQ